MLMSKRLIPKYDIWLVDEATSLCVSYIQLIDNLIRVAVMMNFH